MKDGKKKKKIRRREGKEENVEVEVLKRKKEI